PDGRYVAYWQVDARTIKDFYMINNTDSLYPFNVLVQYPKVGEDPSSCRIGVISADGGTTKWLPIPGNHIQNYLPRMMWAPDSRSILVQQIPRKQNTNRIWVYNIANEQVKNIYTDKDDAWVRAIDDWIWLNDGKEFSWLSEKDGWNHFYRICTQNGTEKLVTPGDYDVVSIVLIDDKSGYVYFIASPDNPTQRYLFRNRLDGKGTPERLSPTDQPGDHIYQVSPGGKYAFHTYSNANTPPIVELVSLPSHKSLRVLVANQNLHQRFQSLTKKPIEFFEVTTKDQVEMQGYMVRPPDFDPQRKYPVLFYVYGEPAGQTARDRWGGTRTLWHLMLAQQGYIVVTMDNRGTPSPKGRDWRKSIFRKIGVINARDQAMATLEVLKQDFIDSDRVGVWGWSGGGSMTLNLLFQYPEIYKTGMSIAPVANQMLYDNIYQERYMGVPWETKEDFIKGSPVTYAKNLQGDLLLVHGTGDDNVHYQNAEVLINELIKYNKQFQLMSYPNRTHSIREGKNTTRHLYGLLTKYLNDHLEPGGKSQTGLPQD
ncbi:MAG: S9 family peptidase, partial [Cyclobacteriaceae bacterium]|nr:S9 family peptidase [Cyclobacteriaceae bacterium]